ncbi:MAG: hypothetical protein OXH28_01540 [bacterium]|nr:hypothetical protein [bacterium]
MTSTGTTPIRQWRVDVEDYVQVLEVHRDGGQAVVGSLGGDAALIDIDDGSAIALGRHEMGVLSAAWSADGSRVAVGGQDGSVRIYDHTGSAQGLVAASAWVTALAWSPAAPVLAIGAGRHLLIADQDGAVLHDFDDQPSTVTSVAWSTDGTRVGATAYGGIGWHDVIGPRSGRRRRFDWKGSLLALVMSPDGSWACAGAQDASVHLWRLWSGRDLSMSGYPSKIERLGFRHDSRWLAVACLEELTVWDFGGRGPAGTTPAVASGHDNHIEDVAWDPSGRSVATGGGDGHTIVWPTPTRAGQDLSPVTAIESDAATSRLRWADEDSLLVGRADGSLVKLAL